MAVLARLVHIPARVVIGYTQGTIVGTDTWQVKTSDAHAWPELYFAGAGWLRFEPTPGQRRRAGRPGHGHQPALLEPVRKTWSSAPTRRPACRQNNPSPAPAATSGHSSKKGFIGKLKGATGGGWSPVVGPARAARRRSRPLALVLLAVLLIAPGLTRLVTRRWRWWKARRRRCPGPRRLA